VEFRPDGANSLSGTRGRQDCEFECECADAAILTQIGDKLGHFTVRQRRMMSHWRNLGPRWQQLVEVTSPPCRVVTVPIVPRCSPVQHPGDAPAQAPGSLGALFPKRLQDAKHEWRVNRRDWKASDLGIRVSCQG